MLVRVTLTESKPQPCCAEHWREGHLRTPGQRILSNGTALSWHGIGDHEVSMLHDCYEAFRVTDHQGVVKVDAPEGTLFSAESCAHYPVSSDGRYLVAPLHTSHHGVWNYALFERCDNTWTPKTRFGPSTHNALIPKGPFSQDGTRLWVENGAHIGWFSLDACELTQWCARWPSYHQVWGHVSDCERFYVELEQRMVNYDERKAAYAAWVPEGPAIPEPIYKDWVVLYDLRDRASVELHTDPDPQDTALELSGRVSVLVSGTNWTTTITIAPKR